ncbi:MAG: acetolactate decarboxylase [Bacteroidota bacterium]
MKYTLMCLLSTVFILLLTTSSIAQESEKDAIYQTSTIDALQEGVFEGNATLQILGKFGNFGIGTFQDLDGEMVLIDGYFYQIKADGKVYQPVNSTQTPFAMITFFELDMQITLEYPVDLKELLSRIDSLLPTKNIFYAIRIDGDFSYVKTRSVPKQTKPYSRLADVVKNQSIFELENLKGTIIGYWLPEYMKGISSTGYHLHFISADKKSGGHLLGCQMTGGIISLDYTYKYNLDLPVQSDFFQLDLSGNKHKELEKIEK